MSDIKSGKPQWRVHMCSHALICIHNNNKQLSGWPYWYIGWNKSAAHNSDTKWGEPRWCVCPVCTFCGQHNFPDVYTRQGNCCIVPPIVPQLLQPAGGYISPWAPMLPYRRRSPLQQRAQQRSDPKQLLCFENKIECLRDTIILYISCFYIEEGVPYSNVRSDPKQWFCFGKKIECLRDTLIL